jgi:UDP-glucuronate 4-epimerase
VFNHGNMQRDFTYIDDIVEGVYRVMQQPPEPNPDWSGDKPDPGTSYARYRLYNIGNNNPVQLSEFIAEIETALEKKAIKNYMDIQPGDVPATYADIDDLTRDVGFKPSTPLSEGIQKFIDWYRTYYKR